MDSKKVFFALMLSCLLLFSSFFLFTNVLSLVNSNGSMDQTEDPVEEVAVETDLTSQMGLYLHLVHKRDGEVVGELWKENDLILSNWVNYTGMSLFTKADFWGVKDDQGQTANLTLDEDMLTQQSGKTGYIAIGTDNTAPTFDDYVLGTETHREEIDDWLIETSGTSYNLTATAFFTFSSSYSITEAGWCVYMQDFSDEVFFTRDTFSSQDMVENDTLSVSIIMEFTGGITDNWGYWIGYALGTDEDQLTVPDYSGYGDGDDSNMNDAYWTTYSRMWIGTSSSAFALTDNALGNKVYEDILNDDSQVIYDESGSDANITIIGYFSVDATYDIYEVGAGTSFDGGDGDSDSSFSMTCREVLASPWSVESGDNIAVYLKWIIDQP